MSLRTKQSIIALLSAAFIVSLIFVQWMEVSRRRQEEGVAVGLQVATEALDPAERLRLPGVVPEVVGRDDLVEDVPVALPRLLEQAPDALLRICHRRSFRSPAPPELESRERRECRSREDEADPELCSAIAPPSKHRGATLQRSGLTRGGSDSLARCSWRWTWATRRRRSGSTPTAS